MKLKYRAIFIQGEGIKSHVIEFIAADDNEAADYIMTNHKNLMDQSMRAEVAAWGVVEGDAHIHGRASEPFIIERLH